ncbi:hypothetical protein WGT02_29965 (plasmid) [Rhizobium sp. T1470]
MAQRSNGCSQPKKPAKSSAKLTPSKSHNLCGAALADALQAGDVFVVGAETFDDYRRQLLSWSDCEARLADYCADLGLPHSGEAFAAWMKEQLMAATAAVDAGFPENMELSIDAGGVPHLKQQKASSRPEGLMIFEA